MGRTRAFGYFGGKFYYLDWLLRLLPPCYHYCEPYGGSMVVLLNRPPSPVETYNDIDSEVVNFFRVLRERPDDLIRALRLTPVAREEFADACRIDPTLDPLERARRFYIRVRQGRHGISCPTPGMWGYSVTTSRRYMSGTVSRWIWSVERLVSVAERIRRVQIDTTWLFG